MNKTQLLEATGVAVREAVNAEAVAKRLVAEATNAIEAHDNRVNTACEMAWKASQAGITGEAIAGKAGVTAMTVSRYIAGGKLMQQTEGKVTGSKAVSDIGNGYVTVGEVKNCENANQYAKAVKAGKDKKNGKTDKADPRSPLDVAKSHVEAVGKAIKAGKVTLEEVTKLWVAMVESLEAIETEMPEDEEEMLSEEAMADAEA